MEKINFFLKERENSVFNNDWRKQYCCGCGACSAICKNKLNELKFDDNSGFYISIYKELDFKKCKNCNLCIKVCPIFHYLNNNYNLDSFNFNIEKFLIGPFLNIYKGYSCDKDIRFNSSSGGITTTIICCLLKKKYINGAITVLPYPNDTSKHYMTLTKSADEAMKQNDSIYCQVNYSTIWNYIHNNKGKILLIGLPCQLKAVELYLNVKKADTSKLIKIGLFCGGISSHLALDFLYKRKNIDKTKISKIRYRNGGWPGRKMIITKLNTEHQKSNDKIVLFDTKNSLFDRYLYKYCFSGSFFPECCNNCLDQTSESADISLGDAWLPDIINKDNIGTNIVITRTKEGQKIINDLKNDKYLNLKKIKPEDVICSQGKVLFGKKLNLWNRSNKKNNFELYKKIFEKCRNKYPQYFPDYFDFFERKIFNKLNKKGGNSLILLFFIIFNIVVIRVRKIIGRYFYIRN